MLYGNSNPKIIKKCSLAKCDSILDSEVLRGKLRIKSNKKCLNYNHALKELHEKNETGLHLVIEALDYEIILDEMKYMFLK